MKILTWHSLDHKEKEGKWKGKLTKVTLLTSQENYKKRQQGIQNISDTGWQPSRTKVSSDFKKKTSWKSMYLNNFKVQFTKHTSLSSIVYYVFALIIMEIFILKDSWQVFVCFCISFCFLSHLSLINWLISTFVTWKYIMARKTKFKWKIKMFLRTKGTAKTPFAYSQWNNTATLLPATAFHISSGNYPNWQIINIHKASMQN